MELCLIWAQDRHGAIGRHRRVPWHLPEDLAHFRHLTMDSPIIMGRGTWEAIGAKALPGRMNIVLSRSPQAAPVTGASCVSHLNDALQLAGTSHPARAFVIGGPQVFTRALPVAQRVYVTEVDTDVSGADAFAPELPPLRWHRYWVGPGLVSRTGLRYQRVEYRSIRRV